MNIKLNLFILLFAFSISNQYAQENELLSKEEVVSRVLENNLSLKIADESFNLSQADIFGR